MRVVGGVARGVPLVAPAGSGTRPTSDRVREAIFNTLFSLGGVDELEVVDLFAGSGALGIEALSRGAVRATFVEHDRAALETIATNLERTGLADGAVVVPGDAARWRGPADVVLADPPYAFTAWSELLEGIDAGLAVLESDRALDLPPGWVNVKQKTYGGTVVTFARPVPGHAVPPGAS